MKPKGVIPNFKSKAEEAEWWYKNRAPLNRDFLEAAKKGKLKRLDQAPLNALGCFEVAGCLDPAIRGRY